MHSRKQHVYDKAGDDVYNIYVANHDESQQSHSQRER